MVLFCACLSWLITSRLCISALAVTYPVGDICPWSLKCCTCGLPGKGGRGSSDVRWATSQVDIWSPKLAVSHVPLPMPLFLAGPAFRLAMDTDLPSPGTPCVPPGQQGLVMLPVVLPMSSATPECLEFVINYTHFVVGINSLNMRCSEAGLTKHL